MLGKRPRPLLRTSSRPQLPPCPGHGCPDQFPDDCNSLKPALDSPPPPPPPLPLPSTPAVPPPASVSSKPKFLIPTFGAPPPRHVVIGFNLAAVDCKHGDACDSPRSVLDSVDSSSSAAAHGSGMAKVGSHEKQGAKSPRSALEGLLASPRSPWGRNVNQGVGLAIVAAIKAEEEEAKGRTPDAGACNPGQQVVAALKCGEGVKRPPSRSQPITIMNPKPVVQQQKQHAILFEDDTDDEEDGEIEAEADSAALPWSRHGCRSLSASIHHCLEPQHQEAEVRQSIFCAASPVSSICGEAGFPGADFLQSCFLCRRVLAQGKDIFMYRGDRAFCSPECRYQQIVLDERKDRCVAAANCYTGPSSQHNRLQAAAATAAAA